MSVTREQLFKELQEWYENRQQNRWGLFDALEDAVYHPGIELPSGTAVRVHGEGGEGEGTTYFYVFSIGDQLFRVDGYYASWDGVTYDDALYALSEVEAVETTVIRYNKKK
jgi:hypothetical protein